MTDQPITFDDLRARAITAAQDASGKIWTDYNLHDPGVTLLEQSAFALSEIAYQGDHDVRDLLTTQNSSFDPAQLGIFLADDVLPGRPVTRADLASYLSEIEQLERVFVTAGPAPGLIDLVIIPRIHVDPAREKLRTSAGWQTTLILQVRACFEDNRLLATALNRIDIATPKPVTITGAVEIEPNADADRIIAEIIHQMRLLFRGLPSDSADQAKITGASRNDIFDNTSALWGKLTADAGHSARLETALACLRNIVGITHIGAFDVIDPAADISVALQGLARNCFLDPILPSLSQPNPIQVTRDGGPVALNPNTICEELGRITAARIARQANRKAQSDWDVGFAGKYRGITGQKINETLPTPYKVAANAQDQNGGLNAYRAMIDRHFTSMRGALKRIPTSYAQNSCVDTSNPVAVRNRISVLNYLIALQGEEMPQCDPTSLHAYRGVADRVAWDISWRESYLRDLPAYNHYSGTAHPQFGFAARLAHLADLDVATHQGVDAVTVDPNMEPPAPTIKAADVILPVRPLDAFVTRDDSVAPLSLAKLAMSCPWVVDARTAPDLFRRAMDADAYVIARNKQSDWEVLFQPYSGSDLYPCGSSHNRANVAEWANRLRVSFIEMHKDAEKFWLFEDIALRQKQADYAPLRGTLLIPGWTARTSNPSFRTFFADLVTRLAPAHLHIRALWLTPKETCDLRPLLADWYNAPADHTGSIRHLIQDISQSAGRP
jgi:hypothetical protein